MDIAARELNLKPEEIRRINLVKEQPYKTVFGSVYDGGNYEDVLDKALKLAEVEKYRNRPYTSVLGPPQLSRAKSLQPSHKTPTPV